MNGRILSVAALALVLALCFTPPAPDDSLKQARARVQWVPANTWVALLAARLSLPSHGEDLPVASNDTPAAQPK